ncbi:MAG: response regulator [Acidobacteria bacterium]|nr:response regulator [Acidobacteriota bacterium]
MESIRLKSLHLTVFEFLDTLTTLVCYLLVALTFGEILGGWLRERDRYRVELLLNVAVLVGILLGRAQVAVISAQWPIAGAVFTLVFLLQPVLLLLLVRRFRRVAPSLWAITSAAGTIGTAISMWAPFADTVAWRLAVCAYFALALSGIGYLFYAEAVRVFGAAAMRLRFAAAGTWLHAIIAIIFAISIAEPATEPTATIVRKTLGVTMFGVYYVGLVGPRRLVAFWTHRELYRYLRLISSHRPDQLADEVPADLARAAAHSVVSAASAVMLFTDESSHSLTAHTVGPSALRGITVPFGAGLVTDAIRQGTPLIGRSDDCEPGLSEAASAAGRTVAIVPIASPDHSWGALVVVQRTGSLFPEDDLRVLTALCAHSASALAQARALHVEFERLRREAAALRQSRSTPPRPTPPPALSLGDRPRVLAVEDEEGVRDYLLALLTREGYRVTLATGYDDALSAAAIADPFDLVVTDVMMPDGSGPALVDALRLRQPTLPAIFISGISREEFETMAPGEERNFLQKPFEGARLVGRIESLLQR